MEVRIIKLDREHLADVNRLESAFITENRLVVKAENGHISHTFESMPQRQKCYPPDPLDLDDYLTNPERAVFLAFHDNQLAGQIRLSKYWNSYAYVDDIVVAAEFRRQGIGRALLDKAFEWAREGAFPGVMVETQDINVAACKLYESCGMILGGFDVYLYKGVDPESDEVALYWYKLTQDSLYDLTEQYRFPQNLQARINLHERFSVNKYGWQRWVFDQFDLPGDSRILELGCGPGKLWLENLERILPGWDITLSDFSTGMIEQVRRNLVGWGNFRFEQIEAGSTPLPFAAQSLDAVIANHMLFHVQNKIALFTEIQRVLKPDGLLYATTVGKNHLKEISILEHRFEPNRPKRQKLTDSFTLENGENKLSPWFGQVEIIRYDDALEISEAGPFVEFILSLWVNFTKEQKTALMEYIQFELDAHDGTIRISKDSGMFKASRLRGR